MPCQLASVTSAILNQRAARQLYQFYRTRELAQKGGAIGYIISPTFYKARSQP